MIMRNGYEAARPPEERSRLGNRCKPTSARSLILLATMPRGRKKRRTSQIVRICSTAAAGPGAAERERRPAAKLCSGFNDKDLPSADDFCSIRQWPIVIVPVHLDLDGGRLATEGIPRP